MRELRKIKTGDTSTSAAPNTFTRIITPTAGTPVKFLTKIKTGDLSAAAAAAPTTTTITTAATSVAAAATAAATPTTSATPAARPTAPMPTYITLRKADGTLTSVKVVGSPIHLKSFQQRQQVKPGESLLCAERIKAQQQQKVLPRIAMPIKTTVLSAAGLSAAGLTTAGLASAGLATVGLTNDGSVSTLVLRLGVISLAIISHLINFLVSI